MMTESELKKIEEAGKVGGVIETSTICVSASLPDESFVIEAKYKPKRVGAGHANVLKIALDSHDLLVKEVRSLRGALEFYADSKNYGENDEPGNLHGFPLADEWEPDQGSIAREALNPTEEKKW